ncbi:MAG: hypothetical protein VX798_11440 [Bacteroidota bacterium]|nr:hypothetical protein [Bacteroidota bacterium]
MKKSKLALIYFFVFLYLIFAINSLQAKDNKRIDVPERPSNFFDKVAQFKMFPNNTDDIVFLRNSVTTGAQWNQLLDLDSTVNRGISGGMIFGFLERFNEVTEGKSVKVFILTCVNDLSRNIPNDIILQKIAEQKNVKLINLYPHFLDDKGRLNIKYTDDELYSTAQGYASWVTTLRPYLQ